MADEGCLLEEALRLGYFLEEGKVDRLLLLIERRIGVAREDREE